MQYRTITIHDAAESRPEWVEPHLEGEPQVVQHLLQALEAAVRAEFGEPVPAGRWLRELRLDGDEAWCTLAPLHGHRDHELAQTAFETLRRLLHDTDIYVGEARH